MSSLSSHYARLKDGRVLCERLSCGYTLAKIIRDGQSLVLYVDPGWYVDNAGVWRYSRRAWQRRNRGDKPRLRRALPANPVLHPFLNHILSSGALVGPVLRALPAGVVCPNCDLNQWFDGERLGVVAGDDEAWVLTTAEGETWMVTPTTTWTLDLGEARRT